MLFASQALLVASDRRDAHRRLRATGLAIGGAVAVTGFVALILAVPRLIALSGTSDPAAVLAEHLPSFAGDFGTVLVLSAAVAGGGYLRRQPRAHKELMVLAAMTLMSPPWPASG